MVEIGMLFLGYTLFYWGLHHFPGLPRYSLWTLLGLGAIIHSTQQPVQFGKGGGVQQTPSNIPPGPHTGNDWFAPGNPGNPNG